MCVVTEIRRAIARSDRRIAAKWLLHFLFSHFKSNLSMQLCFIDMHYCRYSLYRVIMC